jgi:hypothetical protein
MIIIVISIYLYHYNHQHHNRINNHDNNSIQFFIIYVPSQQLQDQLRTQRSVDTRNYIMDKHNIKSKANYRQAQEEKHIHAEK